jgi:hypothetical protein
MGTTSALITTYDILAIGCCFVFGMTCLMAYTLQRLMMYALISALERDLSDFLTFHVAPHVEPKSCYQSP